MLLSLFQLLRSPEYEMDAHFEVNMKVKRERPEREPLFSRLFHLGEQRVLDTAERYIAPKHLLRDVDSESDRPSRSKRRGESPHLRRSSSRSSESSVSSDCSVCARQLKQDRKRDRTARKNYKPHTRSESRSRSDCSLCSESSSPPRRSRRQSVRQKDKRKTPKPKNQRHKS